VAACGCKQTAIEKAPGRIRFYTRRFFSNLLAAQFAVLKWVVEAVEAAILWRP
jgi:hypothetical protein